MRRRLPRWSSRAERRRCLPPHEAFVEQLLKAIANFAEATGVERPLVEVELADTSRFVLDASTPSPASGW